MNYQKVIKHGNSLAVVIPAPMARECEIRRGDVVRVQLLVKKVPGEDTSLFYIEIEAVVNDAILANTQKDG